MLKAAVEGDDFFDILTVELERPAPSYTYDTVVELFALGWKEVRWLVGADQVLSLPKWHRAAELIEQVKFVVAGRPGYRIDWDQMPGPYQKLREHVVETPMIEISSTEIRKRVQAGRSIRNMVPMGVEKYIQQSGLYRQ